MDRERLARAFADGKTLEQVGREAGVHASTVGHWAQRHGLRPPGAQRFAARGEPDRRLLEALAAEGATLAQMADQLDRSIATVRHWLRRWEIERADRRRSSLAPDAPREVRRSCPAHGPAIFRLDARRTYRCARCAAEAVSRRRRKVKLMLVSEAGGCCVRCGYDRCVAALHFHHLEPGRKVFALSRQGVTRSLAAARAEAEKCVLLCANCHAEVESGYAPGDIA